VHGLDGGPSSLPQRRHRLAQHPLKDREGRLAAFFENVEQAAVAHLIGAPQPDGLPRQLLDGCWQVEAAVGPAGSSVLGMARRAGTGCSLPPALGRPALSVVLAHQRSVADQFSFAAELV